MKKRKGLIMLLVGLFIGNTIGTPILNTANAVAGASGYTQQTATFTTGESTSSSITKQFTVPYVTNIKSVSVNTGSVTGYRIVNGNTIEVSVSGGSATRSSTPSTYVTSTQASSSNSFPGSIYVTQNGISGYIGQSGGSWAEVVSGSDAGSFYTEVNYDYVNNTYGRYNGGDPSVLDTGHWTYAYPSVGYTWGAPGYLEYKTINGRTVIYGPVTNSNSDGSRDYTFYAPDGTVYRTTSNQKIYTDLGGSNGYYGVLKQLRFSQTSSSVALLSWGSGLSVGGIYNYQRYNINAVFGGTVSKPDTRVWQYKQNYAGTIYGSTTYYYNYNITVNYEADPNPTITASLTNNGFGGNYVSWTNSDSSQSYTYDVYRNGTLIANDISSTNYSDTSAKDTSAPTSSGSIGSRQGTKYTLNLSSTDNGTTYNYYVIANGSKYGNAKTSNTVSTTMTFGLQEYLYKISTSSTDTINGVNAVPSKDALINTNHSWSTFGYSGNGSSFAIGTNGWNGLNYGRVMGSGSGDSGVLLSVSGIKSSTNYKASVKVKFPSGMTNAGNGTLFVVNGANNVGVASVSPNGLSASNWTEISTTFNSGTNTSLIIRIDRGDASEVQFTDLVVEEVDNYSTTTGSTITQTLNANTTYYLYVKARDKNNNLSAISKTTIAVPNTTVDLTATGGTNKVDLSWVNSDTTQTYLYDVYRDGSLIASNVSTKTYTDTGVYDNVAPVITTSNVTATRQGTKILVTVNATDSGKSYSYYVIAKGQVDAKQYTSDNPSAVVTSGIKGYSYLISTDSTLSADGTLDSTSNTYSQIVSEGTTQYVNVKVLDNNNNISGNVKVPVTVPTLNVNMTTTLNSITQITLNWTNSDTTQSYLYDIYRNGVLLVSNVNALTYVDTTVRDNAIPNLSSSNITYTRQGSKIIATITPPTDNGTTYSYYIVAKGQSDGKTKNSNTDTETITSGIKGYSYLFTTDNSLVADGVTETTSTSFSQVLSDNTTYYLNVKSVDVQGNASNNVKIAINIPDITVTLNSNVDNKNQVTLTWSNNDNTQSYLYDVYRDGVLLASNVNANTYVDTTVKDSVKPDVFNMTYYREGTKMTFKITSPSIDKGTSYTYYVVAKGQSDLLKYTSNNSTATVISGINKYQYSLYKQGTTGTIMDFPVSGQLSTVLQQGQQYVFTLSVVDNQGNSGVNSYNITFAIPTITTQLAVSEVSNGVKLDYNTYADATVDTTQTYLYDIYRDGSLIASNVNANSYVDTNGVDKTVPNVASNLQVVQDMNKLLDYEKANISYNNSTDNGTTYKYYVIAKGQADGINTTSNSPTITITSGLKGYYYIIDSVATTNVTATNSSFTNTNTIVMDKLVDGNFYLHMATVDNKGNISATVHKNFIVVNLMKINGLKLTDHIDKPIDLSLPVTFPSTNNPIKTGFYLTFEVNTDSVDKVDLEFYNNNQLVTVNKNQSNVEVVTNSRNTTTSIVKVYLDNVVPKNGVIDIKIKGIKERADGTKKELVNITLGQQSLVVVGISSQEAYANMTN